MIHRLIIAPMVLWCGIIQNCIAADRPISKHSSFDAVIASRENIHAMMERDSLASTDTLKVTRQLAQKLFLDNNLSLLAARYHLTSSDADLVAAKFFPNPQFTFNSSFIDLSKRPVDYSATQLTYRIDELIELGGKRGNRIDVANHSVESAKADFQNTLLQLLSDLKEAYYEAAFAQKIYESVDSSYLIFKQSVDIGRTRYKSGDISEAEFKKLELAQLDAMQTLSDSRQNLTEAISTFRQLLDLAPAVPLKFDYDLKPALKLPDADSLDDVALRNRPDLVSQREKTLMQKSRVDLAHSNAIPDLTFGVELDRQGPNYKTNWGGGLGIAIPIFNRNQDDIQRAEAESHASELDEKAKVNAILNDVHSAYEKYRDSWNIVNSFSSSTLEDAAEVRAMAVKSYNTGNIGLIDFLETQRIYNDAIQSYYNALKRFSDNQVELERALGVQLFEESPQ